MTEKTKEKDYMTDEERKYIGMVLYYGGQDYGWEKYEEKRHFILTNPEAIKDFHVAPFASNFRNTGHYEWEVLIAMWLLEAARKAIDEGGECDVSKVFNVTLLARPKRQGEDCRRLTPEMIWDHLKRFFDVVEESKNSCKITARV